MRKGCAHGSISEKMACSKCGSKFMELKGIFEREARKDPSLVQRKQEFKRSAEYGEMATQLADRVKRDPLYKKHLWLSSFGTPEEKALEAKRANSGFYKKHSEQRKKWL